MTLFPAKKAAARVIGSLSRRSGRGGGTSLPGKALLRLAPDAIERLAAQLADGVVLVSATNGKTTSSALVAAALEPDTRCAATAPARTSSPASPARC